MTINRPVIIADARYIEGKPVSRVYHLITNNCLRAGEEPLRLETDENTALAFGYRYCATCRSSEERTDLQQIAAELISEHCLEDFAELLPTEIEVRIYYHWKDRKQPKQIWSSRGKA